MSVPSQPSLSADDAVSPSQIDASCRLAVLGLFVGAALWLAIGTALWLVASLKLIGPDFLSHCPCLTYGRVKPAATNAFIYGFASQAALGVALWQLCRLGRVLLTHTVVWVIGSKFWNLGVALAVFGILAGDTTGIEGFEAPRYASPVLFVAYSVMAVCALLTFRERREPTLYVSQWYLLAALFSFPWLYSTAAALLVFAPVRGVLQVVISGWFANGLKTLWLTPLCLASVFYFLPKLTERPLHSRALAAYGFWLLAIFGGWGGIAVGLPVPRWIPAVSTTAAGLMLIPVLAVAVNCWLTIEGNWRKLLASPALRFIAFGLVCYIVTGVMSALGASHRLSSIRRLTSYTEAHQMLFLFGFVAMTLAGAIYYIVPRLTQQEWARPTFVNFHFGVAAAGVLLCIVTFLPASLKQGFGMADAGKLFPEILNSILPFIRVGTFGVILIAAGNVAFVVNLIWTCARFLAANCPCQEWLAVSVKPATAGAAR